MKYSLQTLASNFRSLAKRDGLNATIAKGAANSFLINVSGMGLAFVVHIFLARVLGTEEYGTYIYALSWVNTVLLLAVWGWGTASIRFVSAYEAQKHWHLLRGFLRASREVVLLSSVLVAAGFAICVWYLRDDIGEYLALVLWVGCLLIPINALLAVNHGSMLGLQHVVRGQLPQAILRHLVFGMGVSLTFIFFGDRLNAFSSMAINVVAAAATLCLAWRWMFQATPPNTRSVKAEMQRGKWARTALPMMFVSGFALLMKRIDILMLGALVGLPEAGIYAIAGRLAEFSWFGLQAASKVVAPLISKFHSRGKLAELQRVLALTAVGISIYSGLVMLGLILLGAFALGMIGVDYVTGYDALIILLAGYSISALLGPAGHLMTMTGYQKIASYIQAFCLSLNAILNFILIPLYGMEGAAIATATSIVIRNLFMAWYSHSRLGVSTTVMSAITLFGRRKFSLDK